MARSWSFPPFRLEVDTGSLWRDDTSVPLPPKPSAVLVTLEAHEPRLPIRIVKNWRINPAGYSPEYELGSLTVRFNHPRGLPNLCCRKET